MRSPLTVGEHLARGELRDVVSILDSWGFTVANYHVSVWTGLLVIIVIVGVFVFGKLLTRIARWSLGKVTRLDSTQKLLADKLIGIAIWAFAILVGIDILGIDLTALTIFSGAFGLAVGFGLQKTFGNMLAGIILLMDRSIKPGDVIAVSDPTGRESFGQIRRIGIRAISVVTRDRKEYLIPNENLMVNQVVNWSYSSREVRVKAPVGVAYGTDLELAEKLLLEAAVGAPRVLSQPAPNVRLMAFGANAIEFEIRFWITDPEEGVSGARSEVLKRVWHLFKEHSIELPFPQLDLNLRDSKAFQQLAAAIAHRNAGSDEA
ncbi:MAG TPA: mechanosensitive ion channel domain-containing protein [Croceibacterium sp.]|nr:mechanosensitive ion channel domain-containing protein [Croceibacterium sp.]